MSSELNPAIALLEGKLREVEKSAGELRSTINFLRKEAGMQPLPEGGIGSDAGGSAVSEIRPDTFYGKKLQTAVREYLAMRKQQNLGPAKPREIYDAITAGGYQFEASSAEVALIGMRSMMRKRTQFFHKLPNGTYGLTSWYPNARAQKVATGPAAVDAEDDDDEASETQSATPNEVADA